MVNQFESSNLENNGIEYYDQLTKAVKALKAINPEFAHSFFQMQKNTEAFKNAKAEAKEWRDLVEEDLALN